MSTEYQTVFSVLREPYPWLLMVAPFGFVVVGAVMAVAGEKFPGKSVLLKKRGWGIVFIVWGGMIGAIWTWDIWDNYGRMRETFRSGNFAVVEGVIEEFGPRPEYGGAAEGFRVERVRFAYSEYELTGAYNKASLGKGGPIRDGERVRISYVRDGGNNLILKLEIAR